MSRRLVDDTGVMTVAGVELVTVAAAAAYLEVSPVTVRSWIHRGYLMPLPMRGARRASVLRLSDVLAAERTARAATRRARLCAGA